MEEPKQPHLVVGRLLEERGMRLEDFASQAGIAFTTAANLRKGKQTRLDVDILRRVAATLGVTVGELFSDWPGYGGGE